MGFQTSTWNVNGKRSTCFNTVSFLTYLLLKTGTYLSVVSLRISYEYTLEISYFDKQKRKQHASQGDDASTAEATPDSVGRGEQGEARRANRMMDLITCYYLELLPLNNNRSFTAGSQP